MVNVVFVFIATTFIDSISTPHCETTICALEPVAERKKGIKGKNCMISV